jgi:hypothetical protein
MRILHIAPFNTAGVPLTLVKAERKLGYDSRLVTLGRNRQDREEDICLDLPFLDSRSVRRLKQWIIPEERRSIRFDAVPPEQIPVRWTPSGLLESQLFYWREKIWQKKVKRAVLEYNLENVDLIQLDGGLEFYRNGRFIRTMKDKGVPVICCYTGSDLRVRGVIPVIDRLSDLNITVEFDHLAYHPDIYHVPFPLFFDQIPDRVKDSSDTVRIGHAPTNRAAKGSDTIISVIRNLEGSHPVRLLLIEGKSYTEALALKSTCHLFIDQIGNLGYGMNGIESLAMGIPTCSSLASGFERAYHGHPFVVVDSNNLRRKLLDLLARRSEWEAMGEKGRSWVRHVHDAVHVVRKIHHLAGKRGLF